MRADGYRQGPLSMSDGPEAQRHQEFKGMLLMLAATVAISFAQVAFKVSDGTVAEVVWITAGLAAYGGSFFLTLLAYRFGRVAVLFPITAFSYILVAVAGVWLFGESLGTVQVLGLVAILGGIILLGTDTPSAENLAAPQNTSGGE